MQRNLILPAVFSKALLRQFQKSADLPMVTKKQCQVSWMATLLLAASWPALAQVELSADWTPFPASAT